MLALADSGFDVRAHPTAESALSAAHDEWFDLAVVDAETSGTIEFALPADLRKIQPTMPVILLVRSLELPLVVKGIRMGLADILLNAEDPRPLLRRVSGLLRPGAETEADLDPAELDAIETGLALCSGGDAGGAVAFTAAGPDLGQELVRGARERADLEVRFERLVFEKRALEAELKALLSQNADGARMQTELVELRTQREMADAAQAAIDAKAGQLAETRAEIARERSALEEARKQLEVASHPASRAEAELSADRESLRIEQERLREEASRIQQEAARLAHERCRWHEDTSLLAAQEENLRAYEQRLRHMQAQLESDRVLWLRGPDSGPRGSPAVASQDDPAVRGSWEKLQRATELFEADRAVFRDERMALREQELALKRREEAVRQAETKLGEQEKRLRGLPPPRPAVAAAKAGGARSPFKIWRG